jgi:PPE-repeat protein
MYGYAGASAAATTVTPFNPPPPTTNPAGAGTQAAAVTQAAASPAGATQNVLAGVPNSLQSLATGANLGIANILSNHLVTDFEAISSGLSGYLGASDSGFIGIAGALFILNPFVITGIGKGLAGAALPASAAVPAAAAPAALGAGLSGSYGPAVSAGLGGAATVGALSVPQSWATASPAIRLAATALPAAGLAGLPEVGAAGLGGFGGMPPMLGAVNAPRNGASGPRSESRVKVIPQMAGVDGATPGRSANAPRGNAPLSEREELHGLRQAIADLAKERDLLISSAARMLKEATS